MVLSNQSTSLFCDKKQVAVLKNTEEDGEKIQEVAARLAAYCEISVDAAVVLYS